MADKSGIEWTDATWTPIRARVKQAAVEIAQRNGYISLIDMRESKFGDVPIIQPGKVGPHCERVSPGCEHCYSENNNGRCLPHNGTGLPFDRRARELVDIFVDDNILAQPLKWRTPKKVFVCSQTDLFGEWVTDEMIDRVFAVMQHAQARGHVFQVLTKRALRAYQYLGGAGLYGRIMDEINKVRATWFGLPITPFSDPANIPLRNVWLGVSVENQEQADKRIPLLLQTPAAVRWISAEPLLEPINLAKEYGANGIYPLTGVVPYRSEDEPRVSWVVAGGESGPGARPMHPDWVRSLRDQCKAAGVPFLFKQWGEWASTGPLSAKQNYVCTKGRSGPFSALEERCRDHNADCGKQLMYAVGKKAAGRLLDGVLHDEYPKV